jgi:hypothetical protein
MEEVERNHKQTEIEKRKLGKEKEKERLKIFRESRDDKK